MSISMIIAVADNYGIGKGNGLPWKCKADMDWFYKTTVDNIVVMGSKTWDTIPNKPLKNRINIVLSKRDDITGADFVIDAPPEDISRLFNFIGKLAPEKEIIVIGGANVYEYFMPFVDKIYVSRIHQDVEADTFFNIDEKMNGKFSLTYDDSENSEVSFQVWNRVIDGTT